MTLHLHVLDGQGVHQSSHPFETPAVRIGRWPENDLMLSDPAVSRRHLELRITEQGLVAVDLSSRGLVRNGVLESQPNILLDPGDRLQVGPWLLQPEVVALPVATPTPALSTPPVIQDTLIPADVRRRYHSALVEVLALKSTDLASLRDEKMWSQARIALEALFARKGFEPPPELSRELLIRDVLNDTLGLGPLQMLLDDDAISEIMVVARDLIFVERKGRVERVDCSFSADDAVRAVIERIVTPLGRRIDESSPLVDARLKDGSRVNAVIPPLALKGPTISIRKFPKKHLGFQDLIAFSSLDERMARFLMRCVMTRQNLLISGGTGSGKTTLLNVLSSHIPEHERVITIEDAAELRLQQPHVVSLETRPPNIEGKGEYTIRDLVRNALRMRPDRIIVGECRGGEALDMLQAMNTGHDGSMTTGHANSPEEMLNRLETMVLLSGIELPLRSVRQQIAGSIDIIIQQSRFSDGSRRITHITEVVGVHEDGNLHLEDIFHFHQTGVGQDGHIKGHFMLTGFLPTFLDSFLLKNVASGNDLI